MLVLHGHPLSSFYMKAATALFEAATPFEFRLLDLGDDDSRERFYALWPIGKFPVLEDPEAGVVVPETSAILEYLSLHHPGQATLIPKDPDLAWRARLAERIFDLHVQAQFQKVVGDRLRPAGAKDPTGVAEARAHLGRALGVIDRKLADCEWPLRGSRTIIDCAAAPALFYADKVQPFADSHPHVFGYLEELRAWPAFARCLREAEPYMQYFPSED